MTRWLLDGNVLLALSSVTHPHHEVAQRWFATASRFATCPITQGTLLRNFSHGSRGAALPAAWNALDGFLDHPNHEFWPDDIDYRAVDPTRLIGGGQVTDAYLAALARHNKGRVATFDRGFAAQHPDVVTNIGAP